MTVAELKSYLADKPDNFIVNVSELPKSYSVAVMAPEPEQEAAPIESPAEAPEAEAKV